MPLSCMHETLCLAVLGLHDVVQWGVDNIGVLSRCVGFFSHGTGVPQAMV